MRVRDIDDDATDRGVSGDDGATSRGRDGGADPCGDGLDDRDGYRGDLLRDAGFGPSPVVVNAELAARRGVCRLCRVPGRRYCRRELRR